MGSQLGLHDVMLVQTVLADHLPASEQGPLLSQACPLYHGSSRMLCEALAALT